MNRQTNTMRGGAKTQGKAAAGPNLEHFRALLHEHMEKRGLRKTEQREVIVAEAYRDAQKVKGEGDARASALFAQAFGRDPQFAHFYRSLEAYRESFNRKSDLMVVDPSTDFFKALRSGDSAGPASR